MKSRILIAVAAVLAGACFIVASSAAQDNPDDVYWDNSIALAGGGLNGPVSAMTVYDGKLIVAGGFTTAGGNPANHIAAWDGSSWSPLGSGVDQGCWPLIVYGGRLVAGVVDGAVAWDGSVWSPLGSGIEQVLPSEFQGTNPVALAVMNDTLYAAWSSTKYICERFFDVYCVTRCNSQL
jgi:hypothetical protein